MDRGPVSDAPTQSWPLLKAIACEGKCLGLCSERRPIHRYGRVQSGAWSFSASRNIARESWPLIFFVLNTNWTTAQCSSWRLRLSSCTSSRL